MRTILLLCLLAAGAAAQTTAGPEAQSPAPATTATRGAAASSETFTPAVAHDLLFELAEGMESRNARQALAVFDPGKLPDYGRFASHLRAWFENTASFRVYYKLRQATAEDGRGVALVDFEYEAAPAAGGELPARRREQVRFAFARGEKGWKVVEFSPRSLFPGP